ncbi:MAG: NYN domain-containing protein [Planctomycetota bacterium]
MAVIIDGYNLIYASERWADFMDRGVIDAARDELLAALADYFREARQPVTVIFDGRPGYDRPGGRKLAHGPIEVRFAGSRREADDAIIDRVRASAQPRDITVITTDRAIARAVGEYGARVKTSREFRVEVFEELKARRRRTTDGKDVRGVDISYDEYMRMLEEHERQ